MRHQYQGQKLSCVLATMAMLADRPLAELEAMFEQESSYDAKDKERMATWSKIKDAIGLSGFQLPWANVNGNTMNFTGSDVMPSLVGKGWIHVHVLGLGYHAIAYEDGLIYDSSDDSPEGIQGRTLETYLVIRNRSLSDIIIYPLKA